MLNSPKKGGSLYMWIITICFTISMLFITTVAAEPGPEKLIKEYVAAVNAKDIIKLKKLVHPKCLACINDENRDYFDDYFTGEIEERIPGSYKIVDIKPIGKDGALLMPEVFSYPVRPTHWIQIDFEKGAYDSKSILRQIIKLGDTWFMVVPCPTQQAVKQFREVKIAKEKQKARAKVLYQELKKPLLSELKELYRKGKKIQAWKRYSSETGESLSMAKEVLLPLDNFIKKPEAVESPRQEYKAGVDFSNIGKKYLRYEELKKEQESRGFVFLGKFGDSWPAELEKADINMNEISFELNDGTKHNYSGFDGYEILVLRLIADNQKENVVVFRSKEKK